MARMLSRVHPSFCPVCRRGPAGLDCPDDGVDKRTQRAREKREWRREVLTDLRDNGPDLRWHHFRGSSKMIYQSART